MPNTAVDVVQRQVDAYNARDLERIVAEFSDGVQVFRPPALGSRVIDHERIHGVPDEPFEVAAVYDVVDGLIRTVWLFAAD